MRIFIIASVLTFLSFFANPARAQLGEMNLLTDLGTPFPPGCLSIEIPDAPRVAESLLFSDNIRVPSANSDSRDADLNVRIWRIACADEGYSVVVVRLRPRDANDAILVPEIYTKTGIVQTPFTDGEQHRSQLQTLPVGGEIGASGTVIPADGRTWMLAVDPIALRPRDPDNLRDSEIFTPEEYNDVFSIEMTWENYSRAQTRSFQIPLDSFSAEVDPPQFDETVLNGRYNGLWLAPGAERQGLVIQIAEQGDANFVFAIFFTFIDGEPIWVVGNTGAEPMEPGQIRIDMDIPRGGAFMTDFDQPNVDEIDLEDAGEIRIEVVDCNNIKVHYDFSEINRGIGTLELFRRVRTAGYDCNPWE